MEVLCTNIDIEFLHCRDRVIHFLALKAHRKVDLHNRLKKGKMAGNISSNIVICNHHITDKHCENSLSYLDQVLQQVAEQAPHDRAVYNLKPSYYSELKVIFSRRESVFMIPIGRYLSQIF